MSLNYRPDIDGLRTLAVVPVVLFHAGIPGFSGGYVGVDVFFVISGYLITSILLREMSSGQYSLARFYERRIRRIFPALIAMLTFVIVFAPLSLLPSELRTLPREILGTILFLANIVFWREADYFATAAEEKPLLHMWSLGVEEQFYIFAPLALWLVFRYARRAIHIVIGITLITSLALSIIFTPSSPSMAFYLLPTRAWELLVGALIAAGLPKARDQRVAEALAAFGLVLLLYAIFAFDPGMEFPGYVAIVPVLGSALIIQFAKGTVIGKFLSLRAFVGIGLISYSLYLWHWPLTVFFRDWGALSELSGKFTVVALSVIAAWLSWRFVERPFRNPEKWPSRRLTIAAAMAASTLCVAAAVIHLTNGWPSRFSAEAVAFDDARGDVSPDRAACHISGGLRSPERWCRLGGEPNVALWGDSHGVEMARALSDGGTPILQITYSACPPARGYAPLNRPDCGAHNQIVLKALRDDKSIDQVVLVANYRLYSDDALRGITESAEALRSAGKTVLVLEQAPSPGHNVPSMLAAGVREPFPSSETPIIISGMSGMLRYTESLCPGGLCPLQIAGMPILFDDGHLSMTAARAVAPVIAKGLSGQ
ncbi:acyltransferase [Pseudomonas sp. GX19020]|uniref:acyltransferase family protein n=1 Tax=Pseudomonas sp. GX19020 TaxID=2942277 RepID=UPI002018C640|nr:acyltransferase family protein [Pseudomonas sp. GX19020]MCL4065353.1 acyltransferase [Pseudomonas sp. GX19020]